MSRNGSALVFAAFLQASATQSGNWRIPEDTLHVLSLLCGWPGAALAQRLFRHKTCKLHFLVSFWLTIVDMVPDSSTRVVLLRLLAFHI